jgi:hypothetical protein
MKCKYWCTLTIKYLSDQLYSTNKLIKFLATHTPDFALLISIKKIAQCDAAQFD